MTFEQASALMCTIWSHYDFDKEEKQAVEIAEKALVVMAGMQHIIEEYMPSDILHNEEVEGSMPEGNVTGRDVPVKPERVNKIWNEFQCPICHGFYGDDEHDITTVKFCPRCGQAIDWSGVK